MLLNITIALAILGLALLIRSFADKNAIEARNPFFVIVGIFLLLYVGAALFISYRMGALSAEPQTVGDAKNCDGVRVIDEPLVETDLSTGP